MTQDTGMKEGFDWSSSALHILAGAAAGIGAKDGGEALQRGVYVGTALQNSRLKQRQFEQNSRDQEKFGKLKEEQMVLDNQYKQKRLDMMDAEKDSGFLKRFQMLRSVTAPRAMSYRKSTFDRITQPVDTDGAMTYPLDEKDAEFVESVNKFAETEADTDALVYSLVQAEGGDKEAEFISKALGVKYGISTEVDSNGNKFFKTPYGAFPAEYASADKLKKRIREEKMAVEKKVTDLRRTRHLASSGAQKHMLNNMMESNLDSKQKVHIAEQYAKEISGNPIMARSQDFAHTAKSILEAKDPRMVQFELAELTTKLKKGNVSYHQNPKDGSYYVNGKEFNDYVNRYNSGDKVNVMPEGDGMIKVDENLVKDIYDRSGLNNLSDSYMSQVDKMSESRQNQMKVALQSELGMYAQKERLESDIKRESDIKSEEITDQRKAQKIQKGDWSKASPEEVIGAYQLNTTEVEVYNEELAIAMNKRFSDNAGYMNTLKKEYKEFTGNEYDPKNPDASALAVVKQLPIFDKVFSSKQEESVGKSILRKLVRDRKANRVKDVNDRMGAQFEALKSQRNLESNAKASQNKSNVLGSLLDDGEE